MNTCILRETADHIRQHQINLDCADNWLAGEVLYDLERLIASLDNSIKPGDRYRLKPCFPGHTTPVCEIIQVTAEYVTFRSDKGYTVMLKHSRFLEKYEVTDV